MSRDPNALFRLNRDEAIELFANVLAFRSDENEYFAMLRWRLSSVGDMGRYREATLAWEAYMLPFRVDAELRTE